MSATTTRPAQRARQSPWLTAYLVAYNTLSLLAWAYVLATTIQFIASGPHTLPPVSAHSATGALSARGKAREVLQGLGERLFGFAPSASIPLKPFARADTGSIFASRIAAYLGGSYAYKGLGPAVVWTQTGALLEVVHAALGVVKSSPVTVGMQVASRVWMVWGVVEGREETHAHPLFTTMILAWSITECIRYAFYACSLLGFQPKPLLWLRYNTFYILYPLGASSEAFLMASVLPPLRTLPAALKSLLTHHRQTGIIGAFKRAVAGTHLTGSTRGWGAYELFVGFLFVIWWPALYILFTHMLVLRRKVFGKVGGKTIGGVPGAREKKRQ